MFFVCFVFDQHMFPLWSAGDNCSYSFFVVGPEQIQVEELLVDLRALLTRVDLQLILGRICCKVRMSNASTTNGYGGGGTDPTSRGGNCQKVAAHILHPPVDLITVNNNMVNSIGRVPIGTFSSLAFFFFPSIKHSSALTLILLWVLPLCSLLLKVKVDREKCFPCLVKFYIIGHDHLRHLIHFNLIRTTWTCTSRVSFHPRCLSLHTIINLSFHFVQ